MKKKLLFSIAAFAATSIAFANGSNILPTSAVKAPESSYFDGLYIGAGGDVQYSISSLKNDSTSSLLSPEMVTAHSDHALSIDRDFDGTDFGGDVNIGFGKTFNTAYSTYYAGVEFYTQYVHVSPVANGSQTFEIRDTTNSLLIEDVSTSVDLKSDFSYGGRLKLGYLITPKSMIYILAGVEYTKFDVDANRSFIMQGLPLATNNYSFSKNEFAFVPGVGIETMLSNKLSVKAQYTYAMYPRITNHHDFNTNTHFESSTVAITDTSDDKIEISHAVFTLGLTYHFNNL